MIPPETDLFESLIAYWRALRDECGGVPVRSSLNPVDIREMLPFIYLVERRGDDDLYVRLSGTALDMIAPTPMTGTNYLDLCQPEHRAFFKESVQVVCDHRCGQKLTRLVTFQNGETRELTGLSLPMLDSDGSPRYIVGMIIAKMDHAVTALRKTAVSGYVDVKFLSSDFIDLGFGLPPNPPPLP